MFWYPRREVDKIKWSRLSRFHEPCSWIQLFISSANSCLHFQALCANNLSGHKQPNLFQTKRATQCNICTVYTTHHQLVKDFLTKKCSTTVPFQPLSFSISRMSAITPGNSAFALGSQGSCGFQKTLGNLEHLWMNGTSKLGFIFLLMLFQSKISGGRWVPEFRNVCASWKSKKNGGNNFPNLEPCYWMWQNNHKQSSWDELVSPNVWFLWQALKDEDGNEKARQ